MPVRETGYVRTELGGRLGGRTAPGRGQDGLMLSRLLLPRRGLLPGQCGHQRGLIAQVVQGLDEQAVAAGQVQGAMKLAVGQAALRLVGGGVRGLQGRVGVPPAGLDRAGLRRAAADRAADRLRFQQQPQIVSTSTSFSVIAENANGSRWSWARWGVLAPLSPG